MTEPSMSTLGRLEMACGIAWLLDDGFWLMGWKWPCYTACVFAVIFAVMIPFWLPPKPVAKWMCATDSCWLGFNVLWSVGDLEQIDWLNSVARWTFLASLLCLLGALISDRRDTWVLVLGRLRFLQHLR